MVGLGGASICVLLCYPLLCSRWTPAFRYHTKLGKLNAHAIIKNPRRKTKQNACALKVRSRSSAAGHHFHSSPSYWPGNGASGVPLAPPAPLPAAPDISTSPKFVPKAPPFVQGLWPGVLGVGVSV